MKRCPECDFVYEDEQSLCDMDGSRLDFDSQPLPRLQALVPAQTAVIEKNFWRGRIIPALATLVLATVLGLVYYVSTQRQFPMQQQSAAASRQPQQIPTVTSSQATDENANVEPANAAETDGQVAAPSAEPSEAQAKPISADAKSAERRQSRVAEVPKKVVNVKSMPAPLKVPQPTPTPKVVTEKKDSTVGDFLKKTGRLLKKPFKF